MFIVFGFLKVNKPRILLNPGTLDSVEGLHIAIDVLLYSSKYKLKDQITNEEISQLINGKSRANLPLEDEKTTLFFGKMPHIRKYLDGFVWANCVWQDSNVFVLQEHYGHEATTRLLMSRFNLSKINDLDYPSARFSGNEKCRNI